jgi:hypothetical protein
MLRHVLNLFRQNRHVVIVLKPGEAAVIVAFMVQVKRQWADTGYTGGRYLVRSFEHVERQLRDQMTTDMAEDAQEDIAIARALGEYPEEPDQE